MRKTPSIVYATVAIALSTTVSAQPQPSPCETDNAFRAFDFWLGDWNVIDQSTGQHAGTNSIKAVEGNCALSENWVNTAGVSGRSLNYYNPITKKWRQLWVATGAYSLDIEGGLKDGAMQMEGTIFYYANNQSFPFKGSWTPNQNGTVRQYFEQFDPDKQQWVTWFDSIYTRK